MQPDQAFRKKTSGKKGETEGISETYHNFWKEGLRGNFGNVRLPLTF